MSAAKRVDEAEPATAAERAVFESIGHARGEADCTEQMLARLRARQQELLRQIDVVEAECRTLERALVEKLGSWRKFDEGNQRMDEVLPQFRAVTGSFTYRAVSALLHLVNRVRWWLTFGWLRRDRR